MASVSSMRCATTLVGLLLTAACNGTGMPWNKSSSAKNENPADTAAAAAQNQTQVDGVVVTVPPEIKDKVGTVKIGATADLMDDGLTKKLALAGDSAKAGKAYKIATENPLADELASQLSAAFDLSGLTAPGAGQFVGIVYQVQLYNGVYEYGVLPKERLTLTDSSISFKLPGLGIFQPALLDAALAGGVKKQSASPMLGEASSFTSGSWDQVAGVYDAEKGVVALYAHTTISSSALSSCVAILDEDKSAPWDFAQPTANALMTEFDVSQIAAKIYYGGFQCQDAYGNSVASPWTNKIVVSGSVVATITGAPTAASSAAAVSVTVGGTGVTHFKYFVTNQKDCSTPLAYSAELTAGAHTIGVALGDGPVTLCVLGRDDKGRWQGEPTMASWTRMTVAPTVSAGADFSTSAVYQLNNATASGTGSLTYQWSMVSGPGTVSFSDETGLHPYVIASMDGAYVLRLAAADAAGDTGSATVNMQWSAGMPIVMLTSDAGTITNLASVPVQAVFSVDVTGFTASGLTVTGGSINHFSGSGKTYTFNVAPTAAGTVSIGVKEGVAQGGSGRTNRASPTMTFTYDPTGVTETLTTSVGSRTNSSAIPMTLHFSRPVSGLTASGIAVTGGTVSSISGAVDTYLFTVAPTANGAVSAQLKAGAVSALNGATNPASSTLTVTYDNAQSSASLTATVAQRGKTNSTDPIVFDLEFSKNVTGMDLSLLAVDNGTASGLTGSGASYSFTVLPTGDGTLSVSLPAGALTDLAGNAVLPSNVYSFTVDYTPPIIQAITTTAAALTSDAVIPVTVTFSENVTGFTASNIVLANPSWAMLDSNSLAVSGATVSFNLLAIDTSAARTMTVSIGDAGITDLAGNALDLVDSLHTSLQISFDRTSAAQSPYAVTLATTAGSATKVSPIPFTLSATASMLGLSSDDITVSGGSATVTTASGNPCRFTVTPTGDGAISVNVKAGAVFTAAGSPNLVSNAISLTYDSAPPFAVITSTISKGATVTSLATIAFHVSFNESVSGLALTGFTLSGATVRDLVGVGEEYDFNLVPAGDGSVSVTLSANAAQDAAGNKSLATIPFTFTVHTGP